MAHTMLCAVVDYNDDDYDGHVMLKGKRHPVNFAELGERSVDVLDAGFPITAVLCRRTLRLMELRGKHATISSSAHTRRTFLA